MFKHISLAALLIFFIGGCGSSKKVVYPSCKITPFPHAAPQIDPHQRSVYLQAVNRMRAQPRRCGSRTYAAAKPLRWNRKLYLAAYEHSRDMASCCHFSHHGSGKASDWTATAQQLGKCSSFVDRIENNGYTRHLAIAENIAYGMRSVEEVMQQWIESPGHCKNIMNPSFTEFGMAQVKDSSGRYYWTQTFGSQYR